MRAKLLLAICAAGAALTNPALAADIAARVAAGKSAVAASQEARDYYTATLSTIMSPLLKTCAPPGSNVSEQDWKLLIVANITAKGQLTEVEVSPTNAVTACVAERLPQMPVSIPPASAGGRSFPFQVEVVMTNGTKSLPRGIVTPVFSQLVAYSVPGNFVHAFENTAGAGYIQEFVPQGQTVENWSQIITLTGVKDLALKPEASAIAFMSSMAESFKKTCPNTFATKGIGKLTLGSSEAFLALLACGTIQSPSPHGEVVLIVAVKGKL